MGFKINEKHIHEISNADDTVVLIAEIPQRLQMIEQKLNT